MAFIGVSTTALEPLVCSRRIIFEVTLAIAVAVATPAALASTEPYSTAAAQQNNKACDNYCKTTCTPTLPGCSGKMQRPCYQSCKQACAKCRGNTAAVCGSGGSACSGQSSFLCRDIANDEQNCGGCNQACGDLESCTAGECVCAPETTSCPSADESSACCTNDTTCRGDCATDTECCDGTCLDGLCCPNGARCPTGGSDFCCSEGSFCTPNTSFIPSNDQACCAPGTTVACEGNCCAEGEQCSYDQFANRYGCCAPGSDFLGGACCPSAAHCPSNEDFCCDAGLECTPNTSFILSFDQACCAPGTTVACEGNCCAEGEQCSYDQSTNRYGCCAPGFDFLGGACCPSAAHCPSTTDFCCAEGLECTPNTSFILSNDQACCAPGTTVACEGNCCAEGEQCSYDQFADRYGCCAPGYDFLDGACCPSAAHCLATHDFCCAEGLECTPNSSNVFVTDDTACCAPGSAAACEGNCCAEGETCVLGGDDLYHCQ